MSLYLINNGDKGLTARNKINEAIKQLNKATTSNTDYISLENKPSINGKTLEKNVSLTDLGITKAIDDAISSNNKQYYTQKEVESLLDESLKLLNINQISVEITSEDTVKEIKHNMNKYPNVLVLDKSGNKYECMLQYNDLNTLVVTLKTAITGYIIIG